MDWMRLDELEVFLLLLILGINIATASILIRKDIKNNKYYSEKAKEKPGCYQPETSDLDDDNPPEKA